MGLLEVIEEVNQEKNSQENCIIHIQPSILTLKCIYENIYLKKMNLML